MRRIRRKVVRTRDPSGAGGAGRQQQPAHGGVGSTRGWSEGRRDQRGREQEEEEMKNEAFLGFLPLGSGSHHRILKFFPFCLREL